MKDGNNTKVTGGAVIQTAVHHTDKSFTSMLINNLMQWADFEPYRSVPFILQPFQISRLVSDFPLAEQDYYELLFEKYLELTHATQLPN
ncbi:hypothetical protein LJS80_004897 [Salmonella enterica]|nr:hypothetical protein [Salmonella enterica]EIK0391325.1 hypothetical protein [Salmonella enterica]